MPFILSVSGSTVLSASDQLSQLFTWDAQAIEAGMFQSHGDLDYVQAECHRRGLPFALHSPLFAAGNRYGLLMDDEAAWQGLEQELTLAKQLGWRYLLVHCPRLPAGLDRNEGWDRIAEGVTRLAKLQRAYGVPIVLEPKLGHQRDTLGIELLMETAPDELERWDLSICLDVGDLWMASQTLKTPYLEMVRHLAPWTKVVHLHHVEDDGQKYYWTPVVEGGNVPIVETLALLKGDKETFVVLEHTPHKVVSRVQVADGVEWLRKQIARLNELGDLDSIRSTYSSF